MEEYANKIIGAVLVAMALFVWNAKSEIAVLGQQMDEVLTVIEIKHPRANATQPSPLHMLHAGIFGQTKSEKERDGRLEALKAQPKPEPTPAPPASDDDDSASGDDDDSAKGDDDDSAVQVIPSAVPASMESM